MSAQNREKLARQVLGRHPLKQSLIGVSVIALLVLVWVGLQEANYGGPVIAFILTPVICALLLLSVVAPLEAFFHKKNYNRFFNMIANGEIVPSFFTKRGTVIVDLEHYMIHLDSKESLDLRTLRSLGSRTRRWEKSSSSPSVKVTSRSRKSVSRTAIRSMLGCTIFSASTAVGVETS